MSETLRGLWVDLVVPFRENSRPIDRELIVHVQRMSRVGRIHGVVVNGPAGETSVLPADVRDHVLDVAMEAAPQGFPVLAGLPVSLAEAEVAATAAKEAGAFGLLASSRGRDADEWVALAASAGLPLVLRIPEGATPTATPAAFASTARDLDELAALASGGATVLSALETPEVAEFLLGNSVHGAVLGAANIKPELWGAFVRQVDNGSGDEARSLFGGQLEPIVTALGRVGVSEARYSVAVKQTLALLMQCSSVRSCDGVTFDDDVPILQEALVQAQLLMVPS